MLYVGMSRARHHLVAIARDQKYVEPRECVHGAGGRNTDWGNEKGRSGEGEIT